MRHLFPARERLFHASLQRDLIHKPPSILLHATTHDLAHLLAGRFAGFAQAHDVTDIFKGEPGSW
jgi:hypothetical protein